MADTTEKKQRTLQDVNKDYQMGCLKAGQMQYQIVTLQKDLDLLNATLRDLNFEGAHLQSVTAEAAKLVAANAAQAQAPAPPVEPQQPSANPQGNA